MAFVRGLPAWQVAWAVQEADASSSEAEATSEDPEVLRLFG